MTSQLLEVAPHRPVRAGLTLHVTGLVKQYRTAHARCDALAGASLRVRAGDCVVLCGMADEGRIGPRTFLWCVAGLVRPSAGAVAWRSAEGAHPAPQRALVSLSHRLPSCWHARDALEHAVPPGSPQRDADVLIAAAAHDCALDGQLCAPVAGLDAPAHWRLQLACALASGASWLLLDLPARGEGGDGARAGAVAGACAALRRVARRARSRGGAVIAAADGDGPLDGALPRARRRWIAGGRLVAADPPYGAARVAEPPLPAASSVDLLAGQS